MDEEQFSYIEAQGIKIWLGKLKEELKGKEYKSRHINKQKEIYLILKNIFEE